MLVSAIRTSENADGIKRSHRTRQENNMHTGYKLITLTEEPDTLIDLRIGITSSGTPYACVWIYGDGFSNGSGTATGGNYDLRGTAVYNAFKSAGWKIDPYISGHHMIRDAILAVGQKLTNDPLYLVEVHP